MIRELGDYTITMHFNGKSLDNGRNIREHNLRSTGDDIILKQAWLICGTLRDLEASRKENCTACCILESRMRENGERMRK